MDKSCLESRSNVSSVNEHQCFKINCCAWQMWQQQRNILPTDTARYPKANKKQIYESVLPFAFNREDSASDDLTSHLKRRLNTSLDCMQAHSKYLMNSSDFQTDLSFMVLY